MNQVISQVASEDLPNLITINLAQQIATEINVKATQIAATIELVNQGSTIPFIARYRKEAVGGLDDVQLRQFETRFNYLNELQDRKQTVIDSIFNQGKLTDQLITQIKNCLVKSELEELYAPYKPKRQTKGKIAIEQGLEPLADQLWENPQLDPLELASAAVQTDGPFKTPGEVLDGCKYILLERFSEDANLISKARNYLINNANLTSRVTTVDHQDPNVSKYQDYFEHDEPIKKAAGHRILAMLRGRNQGVLTLKIAIPDLDPSLPHPIEELITDHLQVSFNNQPGDSWRKQVVSWVWKIKLNLHLEADIISRLRIEADSGAIDIFAKNLKALLLTSPAQGKVTLGVDPGIRTGIKLVVVDATGKLLDVAVAYPFTQQVEVASHSVAQLIKEHQVSLIAIGNGTASRESQQFINKLLEQNNLQDKITVTIVNEAGASIYSASEYASIEFPDLDVSLRGAVSIARRLQDPLAELVKIEPKNLGVGQYQHDVNQDELERRLDTVVEDCVNKVGVDLNTASLALLSHVSGIKESIAQNIINYRNNKGRFESRKELLDVKGIGEKTYEQAVGFLRIYQGSNSLDKLGIHPESYPVVEAILAQQNLTLDQILGNKEVIQKLKASDYTTAEFGLPTVTDIINELEKDGRDPREQFKTANFDKDVNTLEDITPGMLLEGVITNIANFGAFVDIGVHQDGLVHISEMSNNFVSDPYDVVSNGQIVKVKVLDVDQERRRIMLTMKLDKEQPSKTSKNNKTHDPKPHHKSQQNYKAPASRDFKNNKPKSNNAFADAFAKANIRK